MAAAAPLPLVSLVAFAPPAQQLFLSTTPAGGLWHALRIGCSVGKGAAVTRWAFRTSHLSILSFSLSLSSVANAGIAENDDHACVVDEKNEPVLLCDVAAFLCTR